MNGNEHGTSIQLKIDAVLIRRTALLGILLSMGLSVSLDKRAKLTDANGMMTFFREFMLSFSGDKTQVFLAAVACCLLSYAAYTLLREKRAPKPGMLRAVAAFFAIARLVAKSYGLEKTVTFLWSAPIVLIRSVILGVSYYATAFYILVIAAAVFVRGIRRAGSETGVQGTARIRDAWEKRDMARLLLAWLPYYIVFYPGTANEDTMIQIMEFFHIKSYIHDMTSVQGADVFITDHHPYFLTQIFGGFAKLGLAVGNIRIGFTLYILLHMVFLAAVFTFGLAYLRYAGVRRRQVTVTTYALMFLPVFPMYAICMVKDTVYAAFCLLMTFALCEIVRTGGDVLKNRKFDAAVFLTAFLMMLTKVYGRYIMAVLCVVCILCYRKQWKRILISMAVPVAVFQFLYLGWFLPAMNVAPGGIQEALSVPFQQTARYMKEYSKDITASEYEAIAGVLPAEELAELYEPQLSNKVKERYNQKAGREELAAYLKAWAAMGLRHPLCYADATLHNIYSYFDIDKTSYLSYTKVNTYLQDHTKMYPKEEYRRYYIENPDSLRTARYFVSQMLLLLQKTPVVNIALSLGLLPYLTLFLFYLNRVSGKQQDNLLLLIPALTICICVLSPENGNCRYVMPMFYLLPYLYAMCFRGRQGGLRDCESTEGYRWKKRAKTCEQAKSS